MNDIKREEHTAPLSVGDPRNVQANINNRAAGYTLTVSLQEGGRRAAAESTVDSYAEAETVAKVYASLPCYKVAVISS